MKRKITTWGMLAILILVAGCSRSVSMGSRIEQDTLTKIKRGETTRDQVLSQLGPPQQTTNENGIETFVYTYFNTTVSRKSFIPVAGAFMGGYSSDQQSVMIKFDEKGVVQSVSTSQSTYDSQRGR